MKIQIIYISLLTLLILIGKASGVYAQTPTTLGNNSSKPITLSYGSKCSDCPEGWQCVEVKKISRIMRRGQTDCETEELNYVQCIPSAQTGKGVVPPQYIIITNTITEYDYCTDTLKKVDSLYRYLNLTSRDTGGMYFVLYPQAVVEHNNGDWRGALYAGGELVIWDGTKNNIRDTVPLDSITAATAASKLPPASTQVKHGRIVVGTRIGLIKGNEVLPLACVDCYSWAEERTPLFAVGDVYLEYRYMPRMEQDQLLTGKYAGPIAQVRYQYLETQRINTAQNWHQLKFGVGGMVQWKRLNVTAFATYPVGQKLGFDARVRVNLFNAYPKKAPAEGRQLKNSFGMFGKKKKK